MSKRGGHRQNAQRPPMYGDTMDKYILRLPAEMIDFLDSTGERDRAANLRNLLAWAAALPEPDLLPDPGTGDEPLGRRYALRDEDLATSVRLGDGNRTAGARRVIFTAMRQQVDLVALQEDSLAAKAP